MYIPYDSNAKTLKNSLFKLPMKIIHITDTHLMPRGTTLHKLNPCERLDACIDNIIEHHSDAEFCVITGDLTHRGDIKSYHDFRDIIQRLQIPC